MRSSSCGRGMRSRPSDDARLVLAGVADVHELQRRRRRQLADLGRRQPPRPLGQVGAVGRTLDVLELAGGTVEADAGQADLGLGLRGRVGDHHDRLVGRTTSPAYSAKRPSRPTLIAPLRWPEANVSGAGVEHHRALGRPARAPRRGPGLGRLVSSSSWCSVTVGVGREREVQRRHRLALGHDLDELVLGHRAQRVVRLPLLTDGRRHGVRHRLAAGRAGAVGGVHPGGVGQGEQLVVQRVVQPAGQLVGGPADRGSRSGGRRRR